MSPDDNTFPALPWPTTQFSGTILDFRLAVFTLVVPKQFGRDLPAIGIRVNQVKVVGK